MYDHHPTAPDGYGMPAPRPRLARRFYAICALATTALAVPFHAPLLAVLVFFLHVLNFLLVVLPEALALIALGALAALHDCAGRVLHRR